MTSMNAALLTTIAREKSIWATSFDYFWYVDTGALGEGHRTVLLP